MVYEIAVITLEGDVTRKKNKALTKMLKGSANYFFLIEENCRVLDDSVYEHFIEVSQKTGVETLMWPGAEQNSRLPFDDDPYLEYYSDFPSAFVMYTRNALTVAGLLDEMMPPNTWQELELAHRIGEAGLSSPFGMFAAPKGVDRFFELTGPRVENTADKDKALAYWEQKAYEDFPVKDARRTGAIEIKPATQMI